MVCAPGLYTDYSLGSVKKVLQIHFALGLKRACAGNIRKPGLVRQGVQAVWEKEFAVAEERQGRSVREERCLVKPLAVEFVFLKKGRLDRKA